jgi:DNA-directed RNA polymerase sigma subunit (sigma70/sigma32)
METALETYRRVVAEQPACDAVSFAEALARYRAGDDSAARAISGSCLRVALKVAEDQACDSRALPLFDRIQEANAGLMDAIATFPGSSLAEFLSYALERMHQRLAVLE